MKRVKYALKLGAVVLLLIAAMAPLAAPSLAKKVAAALLVLPLFLLAARWLKEEALEHKIGRAWLRQRGYAGSSTSPLPDSILTRKALVAWAVIRIFFTMSHLLTSFTVSTSSIHM